jgi:heptosyltransferase-2/heptosyltransferase-3
LFDARNEKTSWLLQRAGWSADSFVSLKQLIDIPGEHFCDHWQRAALLDPPSLGALQHPPHETIALPQLHVSAEHTAELTIWLRRLGVVERPWILIQIGNKRTMRRGTVQRASNTKYWPEERWAEVLRGLRALHPSHALLLLGVRQESALNATVLALAGISDAYDLAPQMNVPRLMALARGAYGMVSVDTGPAHVAAAVGGRALTLFDSPEKLAMYAPRGPGASVRCLLGGSSAAPSLLGISATQVLQAWQELMDSSAH